MVMWQVLIGWRALKAWNNQLLWPARGSAVHAFLFKKGKRKEEFSFAQNTPAFRKPRERLRKATNLSLEKDAERVERTR